MIKCKNFNELRENQKHWDLAGGIVIGLSKNSRVMQFAQTQELHAVAHEDFHTASIWRDYSRGIVTALAITQIEDDWQIIAYVKNC